MYDLDRTQTPSSKALLKPKAWRGPKNPSLRHRPNMPFRGLLQACTHWGVEKIPKKTLAQKNQCGTLHGHSTATKGAEPSEQPTVKYLRNWLAQPCESLPHGTQIFRLIDLSAHRSFGTCTCSGRGADANERQTPVSTHTLSHAHTHTCAHTHTHSACDEQSPGFRQGASPTLDYFVVVKHPASCRKP